MQLKIKDLMQEWLLDCTIRGFSPRTVKSYRNNMDRLINWAEEEHKVVNVEQLTAPIIKMFIMTLQQEQGIKGTYANSLIKTYRAFFVYVVDEYDVPNPMLKVRWCKEIIPIITAFSDAEVKNLLSYYSHRDFLSVRNKTILTLFFGGGLRCAELCSLTADNIHDNFIQLIGKGKKERIVPIDAVMQKQLLKYKQAKDSFFADKTLHCDNLFVSRTGRKLTNNIIVLPKVWVDTFLDYVYDKLTTNPCKITIANPSGDDITISASLRKNRDNVKYTVAERYVINSTAKYGYVRCVNAETNGISVFPITHTRHIRLGHKCNHPHQLMDNTPAHHLR